MVEDLYFAPSSETYSMVIQLNSEERREVLKIGFYLLLMFFLALFLQSQLTTPIDICRCDTKHFYLQLNILDRVINVSLNESNLLCLMGHLSVR